MSKSPVSPDASAGEAETAGARPAAEGEAPARRWVKAGLGVGIGSAAIVAALLYVNRGRNKPQD